MRAYLGRFLAHVLLAFVVLRLTSTPTTADVVHLAGRAAASYGYDGTLNNASTRSVVELVNGPDGPRNQSGASPSSSAVPSFVVAAEGIANAVPENLEFAKVIKPEQVAQLQAGGNPLLSTFERAQEAFITSSEALPSGLSPGGACATSDDS